MACSIHLTPADVRELAAEVADGAIMQATVAVGDATPVLAAAIRQIDRLTRRVAALQRTVTACQERDAEIHRAVQAAPDAMENLHDTTNR